MWVLGLDYLPFGLIQSLQEVKCHKQNCRLCGGMSCLGLELEQVQGGNWLVKLDEFIFLLKRTISS